MDVALVTGAAKGLGFEWARQLAAAGYQVILTARSLEKAQEAAMRLSEQEHLVYPHKLDITVEEDAEAILIWTKQLFGRLDLLINNAGINSGTRAKGNKDLQLKNVLIEKLDKDELLSMVDINAVSPILLAHKLRPLLQASAHPKILNIGSWLGSISEKHTGGNYSYAVSKSALNMMNRAFAFDVKDEGITSVVVNPGWVQTDMGGKKAQFSPQEAVQNLRFHVLERIRLAHSGQFLNYDGQVFPW